MQVLTIADTDAGLLAIGAVFALATWRSIRALAAAGTSDLVVPVLVQQAPHNYDRAIYRKYVDGQLALADWLWAQVTRLSRLSPLVVDNLRVLLTCALAARGIGRLAAVLLPVPGVATLAAIAWLGTNLSAIGYYLRAGVGARSTHAYLSLAIGANIMERWFAGHDAAAAFLAGLLGSYHPVHGVIVALIFACDAAFGISAPAAVPALAAWWIAGWLPLALFLLTVGRHRVSPHRASREQASDQEQLWWRLMVARTTAIFARPALGRGWRVLVSDAAVMLAFTAVACGGAVWALSGARLSARRIAAVALAGALCFIGQYLTADRLRVRALAPLALSRGTSYATILAIACTAAIGWAAVEAGSTGAVTLLLAFGALTQSPTRVNSWAAPLCVAGLLMCVPAANGMIAAPVARAAAAVAALAAALALVVQLRRVGIGALIARREWPLAFAVLCTGLIASAAAPAAPSSWVPAAVLAAVAVLALVHHVNRDRQRWRSPVLQAWAEVQRWAAAHTPPGSTFLTPPQFNGFEVLSGRQKVLDLIDTMLPLYVPAMTADVVHRSRMLGLSPERFGRANFRDALSSAYRSLDEAALLRAVSEFGCGYTIVEREHFASLASKMFAPVFENAHFVILRVGGEAAQPRAEATVA